MRTSLLRPGRRAVVVAAQGLFRNRQFVLQAGHAAIDVVEFVLGVDEVAPEHAEVPLHFG